MPKQSPKFIKDYIIPALENGTYGNLLYWVNRDEGIFKIKWLHKNSAQWNADDAVVFTDWDKIKEREGVSDADYYMKAKQRFRAALAKLEVQVLERNENGYRTYKLNACHIRNMSHNKENIRPETNNENPRIPVASSSRANENNQISAINDVDRKAAEILMMFSRKRKAAETYVPHRPNVLYIQAHPTNMEQPTEAGQVENTIQMQEHENVTQHIPMQLSVPQKIKIMTEAPLMFVVPTYNDI